MRSHHVRAALSLALLPVTAALAQTPPPIVTTGTIPIGLDPIATFSGGPPLDLTIAPDGTDRLFIAGQVNGQVKIYKNGALQATPFLNMPTAGVTLSGGGEKGLLGIAFHPNFAAAVGTPGRGKFYTYTSEPKVINDPTNPVDFSHAELGGTTGSGGDHDSVFREWNVSAANPDLIDTAAGSRILLRIRQPQSNHNGGAIRFGTDNNLYIALGDGGGSNDNSGGSASTTDGHTNTTGNGQDINNIYGKILRIDPLDPDGAGSLRYSIPSGNPFVSAPGLDEIHAYGLRNPFRTSFDRLTGALYAGDVGQGQREEIDIIESGKNYGWVNMEGTRVNVTPVPSGLTAPIAEYTHSDGQAVIGGYLYRGQNIPELYGKYVFGELGWDNPATPETTSVGRLFYINAAGGAISEFTIPLNTPGAQLYAFGEDKDGELYAMFANGGVSRILGRQWLATTGGSWNTAGNWLAGVPNASGASANFLGKIASSATITLDGSKTVGALRFNNLVAGYTIAGGSGGLLTINGGASSGLVHAIRGAHTISAPLNFASNADIRIDDAASLNITAMTVNSGATVSVQDGTPRVGTLATSASKLDLRDQKLVINNMPLGTWNGSSYTRVIGLVAAGRGDGSWNGNGLVTSMTDATTKVLTTLAVATAGETGHAGGTFGGVSVIASDVLVRYTWGGDADLDGDLDGDDYFRIDSNILQSGVVFGFYNGDFNYDGELNGDDYFIIDSNIVYAQAAGPLGSLTLVPEPTLAVVSLTGILLARRRCR